MRARQILAISILPFVLGVTIPSAFATKMRVDEGELRAADAGWMKVFSAKDLAKSVDYCAETGSVLAPNAPIATGREAIAKQFSAFFAVPNLKITWLADKAEVSRSGEIGYTSGSYQMSFSDPSGKTVSDKGKVRDRLEKAS